MPSPRSLSLRILRVLAVVAAASVAGWLILTTQRGADPGAAAVPNPEATPTPAPVAGAEAAPPPRRTRRTVIKPHEESGSLLVPAAGAAPQVPTPAPAPPLLHTSKSLAPRSLPILQPDPATVGPPIAPRRDQ